MKENRIAGISVSYKTELFATFWITLGCFLFTYLYFDFFYVEYEGLFDSFYSGKLTEGLPFRSIYFLGNIGLSYLYSWLYELFPKIEWISWILYTYLFAACFVGLYIVRKIVPEKLPWWVKLLAQISLYLLVFADQNIHFIFTRVSYMVTGISLIAIVYFFSEAGSVKKHRMLFIALNLLFVIGTLTRSESATAAFLQTFLFGIFYLQNIRRFATLFLFPSIFLFSVLSTIAYDLKTTQEFYKQIEPDIEAQLCERENAVALSTMKTHRDSVLWKTAKNIIWSDPEIISPAYLRSLIRPEKFLYTDSRQWERVYRDVSDIAFRFWHVGLLSILLGLLLLLQGQFNSRFGYFFWLVFVASFWLLTSVQTYTVKVNDRSFSPLISIFIFCHLLLLARYLKPRLLPYVYPLVIGVLLLFGFHLYYLKVESNQLKSDLAGYQSNLKTITQLAANKYLVVNSSSCDYLFSSNKPFHPFDFSAYKKLYIVDGFNMPFLPYYRRYLEKECQCDMYAFPSFWTYLRTKKEEVVVVSSTERMDILKDYLKEIRHYDLPITRDTSALLLQLQKSDSRGLFTHLAVYKLNE